MAPDILEIVEVRHPKFGGKVLKGYVIWKYDKHPNLFGVHVYEQDDPFDGQDFDEKFLTPTGEFDEMARAAHNSRSRIRVKVDPKTGEGKIFDDEE